MDTQLREVQALYDDGLFELTVSAASRLVYVRRSERAFQDAKEWASAYARLTREIARYAQPGWSVVYDLRFVRGRNDREFETSTAEYRRRVLTLFEQTAVVVRTAAGQMQVARHVREIRSNARVFFDLRTALAKLGLPMALADAVEAPLQPELRTANFR